MPVTVTCPECGTSLRVPDTSLGKRVRCSKCKATFAAEAPPEDAGVQDAAPERPVPPEEPASVRKRPRRRDDDDDEDEDDADDEDYERRFRRRDDGVEALIPYRNGRALAAYYCGVFSLIPCVGVILGPLALVFGILGVRYAKAHPGAHGMGHGIAGIVLGSLTTLANWGVVLLMVVGLIMAAVSGK
jgi:predicted Zn finger-like uncharacterized protein